MDEGGFPLTSRLSTKRSYSQMADPYHDDDPDSLFMPTYSRALPDDHYNNEHRPQRRRLESPRPEPPTAPHFPGDGLDFRRPVMSARRAEAPTAQEAGMEQLETIDLTDDASAERVQHMDRQVRNMPEASTAPTASSSHAQRLPHFGRNIIDIADSDEEDYTRPAPRMREYLTGQPPADNNRPQIQSIHRLALPDPANRARPRPGWEGSRQPSMQAETSDLEVVGARPISHSHIPSRRGTPMPFTGHEAAPRADLGNNATIDLTADDDDVVLTEIRMHGGGVNGDRPAMAGSVRDEPDYGGLGMGRLANRMFSRGMQFPGAMVGGIGNFLAGANRAPHDLRAAEMRADALRRRRENIDARWRQHARGDEAFGEDFDGLFGEIQPGPVAAGPMGMVMNYDAVAFDLGTGGRPTPAEPKYEPPAATGTGFTRSPKEDEVVVCPNCGDELAVGKGEVKQQVWVNKKCGHAYCGDCVTLRAAPKSKKGKGRATEPAPLPFKKCVVVGCNTSAAKSAMVHVYMQ